jgi:L-ectoine synthase
MRIVDAMELHGTDREVECPRGGFTSIRMLLKSDGMGFTMTRTTVHPTRAFQRWHYKHHLEACYCIVGRGVLKDSRGRRHTITPGVLYALDKHDKHWMKATERMVLICVFNPPLTGREVHQADGSYARASKGSRAGHRRIAV